MSDDTTPLADPVEARLRATLAAEADRHPVTPDLEALRARGDRTIVDLDLSPRRNRARLVAVAAVVALLAGVLGALAVRGGGDDEEPVITDEPPATGYYLPGDGWEVTEILATPLPRMPGTERTVELGGPQWPEDDPTGPDVGDASIVVSRITDEDPDLVALSESAGLSGAQRVARGEGDEAREYLVSPLSSSGDDGEEVVDPASIDTDGGTLIASVDGRVLMADWYGPVGQEAIVDLADRWWESGGEAVALDPATGLGRVADVTYPDVEPVPTSELTTFHEMDGPDDLYAGALLQVVVRVEAPDGWTGTYSLIAPGDVQPTGFGDAEAGAAAGLAPEEVGAPLPAEVGGPMPAWESSDGIAAEVPGALVGAFRSSSLSEPMTAERVRQLWAALAPVSRAAWVEAGPDETAENGIPDRAWGETLVATDAEDLLGGFEPVTGEESDTLAAMGAEVTVEPRDGTDPAAGLAPAEVDRLVADAVLAFVGGPGPVDADLFAPSTTFGYEGDPGAEVSVAIEDVAAIAEDTILEIDPSTPALAAWNVLWTAPADMTRLVGEGDEACPPLAEVAADPAVVVLLQDALPEDQEPCEDWAALVVGLDDQDRITSVEARFGP